MNEILKYYVTSCLSWIPDRVYLKFRYRQRLGFWPNFKSPIRFTEKLQWLKMHDRRPEMSVLADKLLLKRCVSKSLGEGHIIPALSKGRTSNEFSINTIPSTPFVLKTNHDSGSTKLFSDPREVDIQTTQKWLKKRLSRKFYYANREWEYKNIEPMWFTEPLMEDGSGNARLNDFKVHCFNGEPMLIQTITDREEQVKENWFNERWEALNVCYFSSRSKMLEKPSCLGEMLNFAHTMGKPYPYVRVDFYVIDNRPILGEMTFRPYGGFMKWTPDSADYCLGAMLSLDAHHKPN